MLIDAQLPRRLAFRFRDGGINALHTLDLPARNRTPDRDIVRVADTDNRVVATKDGDFVTEHVLHGRPARLLLISTGNIRNADPETLLIDRLPQIEQAFQICRFAELTRTMLLVRS